MARPQIEIDEALLKKLTKLHLSDKVIAECLDVSVDTLHRRFADQMQKWRSESKSKIADVLFDEAVNKREPWALKALAQKHLDYSDKVTTDSKNLNMNYDNLSEEEIDAKIKKLEEAKKNES
jgi:AraC-like DNA-binding protein